MEDRHSKSNSSGHRILCLLLPMFLLTVRIYAQTEPIANPNNNYTASQSSEFTAKEVGSRNGFPAKINLGSHVNSRFEDINPIISADGTTLYFARKNTPKNTGGKNDPQDIWITKTSDGVHWSKSKNMGPSINTTGADNLCSVSADNNTLIFFIKDTRGTGHFAYKTRINSGWTECISLGLEIKNESQFLESCLSVDGNVMVFTAKNKSNVLYQKNVDERDIYVSFKTGTTSWSKPVNLGVEINSAADEYSPFLAADGRTLYFATKGRSGYGDADIFMSKRIGDGWTNWTQPMNLGPSVNTAGFDGYFTIPASGDLAYMVSDFNSFGGTDIIRVPIPRDRAPDPAFLIKGKTIDAKSNFPVNANIIITPYQKADNPKKTTLTTLNGNFSTSIGANHAFTMTVSANGYFTTQEKFDLPDFGKITVIEKNFSLVPISPGEIIRINNLLFEEASAHLDPASCSELDLLVSVMQENPGMRIELCGHTDNRGNERLLQILSEDRAKSVEDYLHKNGIDRRRITANGYGSSKPVVRNDCDENRKKNRRVEVKVTKI